MIDVLVAFAKWIMSDSIIGKLAAITGMIAAIIGILAACKLIPHKTKLDSVKKFLRKKIKQAGGLSKKRNLNANQILSWHKQLSVGLVIALGSNINNEKIELTCEIIKSRIDPLKFYGGSQTKTNLKQLLVECIGMISVMRKELSPDMLSSQFEPDDLKACEGM